MAKQIQKIRPNRIQFQLAKVIHGLVSIKEVDFERESALGYGLSNYIAKYSLAKDHYLVSKKAADIVQKILDGSNKEGLLRGIKKNYPITYEHAIPVNIIRSELLSLKVKSQKNVSKVLADSDIVVIVTRTEDKTQLGGGLQSKMPETVGSRWSRCVADPLARYEAGKVGLKMDKGDYKQITMRGAVER